ncbi:MAG: hypothetical protein WD470_02360, partial [Rhodospirillaceae bacterium]
MAKFVGAFAASHGPVIARDWDRLPAPVRAKLDESYGEMGRRLTALAPDVLVIVSPDHWVNFFIDNLPSFCVGIGAEHDGPPEPFMKPIFPHRTLAGHPGFGRHLLGTALDSDFDPSLSHRLRLDHGFCVPLWRMGLDRLPAIVPVTVNELEEPMPSIRRCLAWGRMLRSAIDSYPEDIRIAVLGTGGLSHSIGEPTMGEIDEDFDHDCIRAFEDGAERPLIDYLDRRLDTAGNGSHEVRNWLVAHGAAGGRGFELVDYFAVPEV